MSPPTHVSFVMALRGDVWVGSSLGILKGEREGHFRLPSFLCLTGVSLDRKETLNYLPAGTSLSQTDKSMEVVCMCWEHQSQDQVGW